MDESGTPPELAKFLIDYVGINENDVVIDAGSGSNKVWFNALTQKNKYEYEIKDGKDFLKCDICADWVIGNPPFTLFVEFLFKASEISQKGFAFLINNTRFNQITPTRLKKLEEKGFYLSKIMIVSVKRWFGRYYFVVFTRNKSCIEYSIKNW